MQAIPLTHRLQILNDSLDTLTPNYAISQHSSPKSKVVPGELARRASPVQQLISASRDIDVSPNAATLSTSQAALYRAIPSQKGTPTRRVISNQQDEAGLAPTVAQVWLSVSNKALSRRLVLSYGCASHRVGSYWSGAISVTRMTCPISSPNVPPLVNAMSLTVAIYYIQITL